MQVIPNETVLAVEFPVKFLGFYILCSRREQGIQRRYPCYQKAALVILEASALKALAILEASTLKTFAILEAPLDNTSSLGLMASPQCMLQRIRCVTGCVT